MTFEEWIKEQPDGNFSSAEIFAAGAASRDAEIADLKRELDNEQARGIHSCHPNCTREGCVNRRLRAELEAARAELEVERVRLAACGVVAMANTPDSAAKTRKILPEYRSASLEEVIRAVDSEMELREQLAAEQAKNVELREEFQSFIDSHEECEDFDGFTAQIVSMDDYHSATGALEASPSDTSALEAIVKKAGEKMRERIRIAGTQGWLNKEVIRALPGVTLDDLKGGA